MADKYSDEAKARLSKQDYVGPKVVDKLPNEEPGLEPVPLLESFIAPASTYRKMTQKLLSRGGATKLTTDKDPRFAAGGKVAKASRRADGIAQRGKTKGRMV